MWMGPVHWRECGVGVLKTMPTFKMVSDAENSEIWNVPGKKQDDNLLKFQNFSCRCQQKATDTYFGGCGSSNTSSSSGSRHLYGWGLMSPIKRDLSLTKVWGTLSYLHHQATSITACLCWLQTEEIHNVKMPNLGPSQEFSGVWTETPPPSCIDDPRYLVQIDST